MKKREILYLVLATMGFYLIAAISYEQLYYLTRFSIKSLSRVPIRFYGITPSWFEDNRFSLIIATIPITIFIISRILNEFEKRLLLALPIYIIYLIGTYISACWLLAITDLSLNDFYKNGDPLYLRQAEIYDVFKMTIISAMILTIVTLLVVNLSVKIKRRIQKIRASRI